MAEFVLHPDFVDSSVFVADGDLCQIRLQDDSRFPWLILIPRVAGASDLDDLSEADRARLMVEIVAAGKAARGLGQSRGRPVDKLNVAALGNVTPQLHVHVIGRRRDDEAWPKPVWGQGETVRYGDDLAAAIAAARG